MKTRTAVAILLLLFALPITSRAEEPTIYVIQKGDTMWGLSERFFKDPYYWPDLWARNPQVANPHFIYPGQKIKVFPDRIEVVEQQPAAPAAPVQQEIEKKAEEPVQEKTFTVFGGEGSLAENVNEKGIIVGIDRNRNIAGAGDIVYTNLGRNKGAKAGDEYAVVIVSEALTHPVQNYVVGKKVLQIGTLQLTEIAGDSSKATMLSSSREIPPGALLVPPGGGRRVVALKAATKRISGYIVDTQKGNRMIAAGEIIYLDKGRKQGLEPGNLMYVVHEISVSGGPLIKMPRELPVEIAGSVVVVDTGENTSTALVIKSADAMYPGDRIETAPGP